MATRAKPLSLKQRGLNFEMLMWLFTRLSALAMYALVLFAVIGALVMGARTQMNLADVLRWGFMSNNPHVLSTNVPDLAPWETPLWRIVASLMVLVATAHGVHGLVAVLDDYITGPRGRGLVRILSILFMLGMIGVGVYVIWTS